MEDGVFRPCYACRACEAIWDRPGPSTCSECKQEGILAVHNGLGEVKTVTQVEPPRREIVAIQPDGSGGCMLECGHQVLYPESAGEPKMNESAPCKDCWRDENLTEARQSPSPRDLMMVGMAVA